MATSMHRLQISLPEWQAQYLAERAEQEGTSMAEVIRGLLEKESRADLSARPVDSIWTIAGIGVDEGPLVDDTPVSESPQLYLTGPSAE